ncbi:MAG: trigger factor [Acidimicrobiia bacterium]
MKTTVEPLEGNKVKLSVEVGEGEMDAAIDAAFRKIAYQVKIPGFRPGKAPRRLVEARVGADAARQEALHDALPDFYAQAVKESELDPIAPPEIDITAGKEEGPVSFDAVVEVMPQVSLAGYEGLRVVLSSFTVDEAEVDAQVDRLRQQYGELRSVERPAAEGDHVSVDRRVSRHDDVVLATDSELFEIGRATAGAELDDNLRGSRVGDILKFNVAHFEDDGEDIGEVTVSVLVKDVQEKVLPEVTDEWASEASEFETVEELRQAIHDQMKAIRKLEAALGVRDKVLDALVELVDEEMPETLVAMEMERRIQMLAHRLSHQGIELGQYLEATGKDRDEFLGDLRGGALEAVKADVALRTVAERQSIGVTDDDIEAEVAELAARRDRKPAAVRRDLESAGEWPAVRSGIRKAKTLEWLIGHTELVDEEGHVIDRTELIPPDPGSEQGDADVDADSESSSA